MVPAAGSDEAVPPFVVVVVPVVPVDVCANTYWANIKEVAIAEETPTALEDIDFRRLESFIPTLSLARNQNACQVLKILRFF